MSFTAHFRCHRRLGRVVAHVSSTPTSAAEQQQGGGDAAPALEVPPGLPGSREPGASIPDNERLTRLFTSNGRPHPTECVGGLQAVSTAAAVAQFNEFGFLVVEQAFSPSEIADALAGITAISRREVAAFNERMDNPSLPDLTPDTSTAPTFYENRESMIYYESSISSSAVGDVSSRPIRKLNGFVAYEPRLATLAERAGNAAAALLASDRGGAMLFQDMALLKPASVGSEKPW